MTSESYDVTRPYRALRIFSFKVALSSLRRCRFPLNSLCSAKLIAVLLKNKNVNSRTDPAPIARCRGRTVVLVFIELFPPTTCSGTEPSRQSLDTRVLCQVDIFPSASRRPPVARPRRHESKALFELRFAILEL